MHDGVNMPRENVASRVIGRLMREYERRLDERSPMPASNRLPLLRSLTPIMISRDHVYDQL